MTGFGRTGRWFGGDHWGLRPDILVAAKGATSGYWPFGFAAASGPVYEAIAAGGFVHGFTFSHSAVGAAVAREVLRILREEDLVAASAAKGERLRALLRDRLGDHPHVGDIRGRGLMVGVELVADRATTAPFPRAERRMEAVVGGARERGVLVYSGTGAANGVDGDTVLLGPPFVTTDDELVAIADGVAGRGRGGDGRAAVARWGPRGAGAEALAGRRGPFQRRPHGRARRGHAAPEHDDADQDEDERHDQVAQGREARDRRAQDAPAAEDRERAADPRLPADALAAGDADDGDEEQPEPGAQRPPAGRRQVGHLRDEAGGAEPGEDHAGVDGPRPGAPGAGARRRGRRRGSRARASRGARPRDELREDEVAAERDQRQADPQAQPAGLGLARSPSRRRARPARAAARRHPAGAAGPAPGSPAPPRGAHVRPSASITSPTSAGGRGGRRDLARRRSRGLGAAGGVGPGGGPNEPGPPRP